MPTLAAPLVFGRVVESGLCESRLSSLLLSLLPRSQDSPSDKRACVQNDLTWLQVSCALLHLLLQASRLEGAAVADVVAAPFPHDASWYRAKVCSVQSDQLHLYYVDFGDSEWVDKSQIRTLK